MTFVQVWDRRIDGLALTFDSDQVPAPAVEWGTPVGGSGPLGDGSNGSGYEMATSYDSAVAGGFDRNILAAALDLGEDPADQNPVTGDMVPSGFEGGLFAIRVSTVIEGGLYQFPPELVDAGYTLTVGFARFDEFSSTFGGVGYPLTTGTDARIDALIDHGITDTGVDGVTDLTFFLVTTDLVDDVNAGIKVPYVGLSGPYSGRDPLLLVADLVLSIYVEDGTTIARPVCRQFPRDGIRGFGSSPRLFPPPRAGRVVGGYQ